MSIEVQGEVPSVAGITLPEEAAGGWGIVALEPSSSPETCGRCSSPDQSSLRSRAIVAKRPDCSMIASGVSAKGAPRSSERGLPPDLRLCLPQAGGCTFALHFRGPFRDENVCASQRWRWAEELSEDFASWRAERVRRERLRK